MGTYWMDRDGNLWDADTGNPVVFPPAVPKPPSPLVQSVTAILTEALSDLPAARRDAIVAKVVAAIRDDEFERDPLSI